MLKWNYEYDLSRRLSTVKNSSGVFAGLSYDDQGRLKSLNVSKNSATLINSEYLYKTDGLPDKVLLKSMDNGILSYTQGALNRHTKTYHTMLSTAPNIQLRTTQNYQTNNGKRTFFPNQLLHEKIDKGGGSEVVTATHMKLNYTYDPNGNIKTVKENDTLKVTYTYDGLNQLTREDNVHLNKSIVYTYNSGGNIISKKEYAYTTGTLGAATATINYAYGDTNRKDKLTSYNGKAITYDQIGNPLTYDGYTYTWQKGRQLAGINKTGLNLSFKYDQSGLRTRKINGNVTTEYTYIGGLLVSQSDGTDTLKFLYDSAGRAIGLQRNAANYYYLYNIQGDVIAIYNGYGNINCFYTYDSWGRVVSVKDASGNEITSQTHISHVNPLRYRGYYYDKETSLYYLQSRYYNPEWGRFLNADSLFIAGDELVGSNMFAYCGNNPVMFFHRPTLA